MHFPQKWASIGDLDALLAKTVFQWHIQRLAIVPLYPWETRNVGFCEDRKTGEPRENLLEQRWEPTTNSTQVYVTSIPGIKSEPQL